MIKKFTIIFILLIFLTDITSAAVSWIRINQLGYLPEASKKALLISESELKITEFTIFDALTDEAQITLQSVTPFGAFDKFNSTFELDFSSFKSEGAFYIKIGNIFSHVMYINRNIYVGATDKLITFMHSQRNLQKGTTRWGKVPESNQTSINATAIFQLLFSYNQHPKTFGDHFDYEGNNKSNGIPDIIDEAKWGLDGILKNDFKQSPASLSGKVAAACAFGADVLSNLYPVYVDSLRQKAIEVYESGKKSITAPRVSTPQSSENDKEQNWKDDMQLAATQLYFLTYQSEYLNDAVDFGAAEPVPQWLFTHSAKAYDFYPYINWAPFQLTQVENPQIKKNYLQNIFIILQRAQLIAKENPFHTVISFSENSNNKIIALHNLCNIYRKSTGDKTFIEMEEGLNDWIFGRNPLGIADDQQTIDGTASLFQLLSSRQAGGVKQDFFDHNQYDRGGINRFNPEKKQIALIFSGHEYTDGYRKIKNALDKQKIKAAFFFSGDFLRKSKNKQIVKKLQEEGHYVGPATNHFEPLAKWDNPDFVKTRKKAFLLDLKENYTALKVLGISKQQAPFFNPPYELYNDSISRWCNEVGISVIRSTPGTYSNLDYTFPEMRENYYSTKEILDQIMRVEANQGLNGYILQFNFGSNPGRKDKFYNVLETMLGNLQKKGYEFVDIYTATGVISKPEVAEKSKRRKK
jgi:peptidoglycan/xylan/chitin deacetylase (PgdA/CDA1 family)